MSAILTAITTRATGTNGVNGVTVKNSPLSNAEIDNNFINLNANKLEIGDAVATNTANTVVKRDGSGNFAAGTISAALSGNASTATTLQTARNINGVSFNGSADILTPTIYDSGYQRIVNPGGGYWVNAGSTVTGALAITLPVAATNTMISITVKVYEYSTNKSFELHVGGYPYTGNTWANNPFAYIIGNPTADRALNVRLGYTAGGKMIIYIGETTSTWSYPQVFVTEVLCGYGGQASTYLSGWSIGAATTLENVTATIASTDTQVGYGVTTNTGNSLVKRDASGNFSAGTITATLSGNATGFTSTTQNSQFNSVGVGTAATGTAGEIRATNNITSWYTSDKRLKENVVIIQNPIEKVQMLNGVYYDWTDDYIKSRGGEDGYFIRKHDFGLIAQDVEQVLPEIVATNEEGYKAIKYDRIVALLVEAVKELKSEIEELKGNQ